MNEEAFQDLYEEFVNTGYRGTKADFKVLMQENREAFLDGYNSFTSTGYNGSEQDFATLIGVNVPVKKKTFKKIWMAVGKILHWSRLHSTLAN